MSIPMLMLWREKLAVRGGHCRDGGFNFSSSLMGAVPRMTQSGSAVIHTPDRSGLPFPNRGGAAARSTSPVAVRGARGLGTLNHCAPSEADAPATAMVIRIAFTRVWRCGHGRRTFMYDSVGMSIAQTTADYLLPGVSGNCLRCSDHCASLQSPQSSP